MSTNDVTNHAERAPITDVPAAPSDPDVPRLGSGKANAQARRRRRVHVDGRRQPLRVRRSSKEGATSIESGSIQTVRIRSPAPRNVRVPNPGRGRHRTREGGTTRRAVREMDDNPGCVDIRTNPWNPDTIPAGPGSPTARTPGGQGLRSAAVASARRDVKGLSGALRPGGSPIPGSGREEGIGRPLDEGRVPERSQAWAGLIQRERPASPASPSTPNPSSCGTDSVRPCASGAPCPSPPGVVPGPAE